MEQRRTQRDRSRGQGRLNHRSFLCQAPFDSRLYERSLKDTVGFWRESMDRIIFSRSPTLKMS
jgi:hypothetical protein